MRISGGKARGVALSVSKSSVHRPATDRLRQGIFSSLGKRIEHIDICDLFAGTGAIGLEALSRGAKSCVFVEQDQDALQTLQANISKLKLEACAHILAKDARQIHNWPGPRADLVFADPPYSSSLAGEGLHQLVVANAVVQQALFVVETRKTENCQLGPEFVLVDSRVYGIARLNFFTLARR